MSKRLGLVSLASMDATTRQDMEQLSNPRKLPCAAGAKCEACVGSCQPLPPIMGPPGTGQNSGCDIDYGGSHQSWIERTRYSVPGSQREVLLYRNNHSKETAYFCFSARAGPHEPWSEPAPSGIPDSTSNMNAGTLPDGRVFLLSNPSTRATLVMSLSRDGYNFSHAYDIAACDRAPFSNPSQPNGCKRRNTDPGVGFGVGFACIGLVVTVVIIESEEGMYVIVVLFKFIFLFRKNRTLPPSQSMCFNINKTTGRSV